MANSPTQRTLAVLKAAGTEAEERRRKQWREHYYRHKDEILSKKKAAYDADPEAAREQQRKTYAANAEAKRRNKMRYVEANREALNARRRAKRAAAAERPLDHVKKFGLTKEQYLQMHKAQGGTCAICKQEEIGRRLAVDHCHTSGKVRGLLCAGCNTALGQMNDDPTLLRRAMEYLIEAKL